MGALQGVDLHPALGHGRLPGGRPVRQVLLQARPRRGRARVSVLFFSDACFFVILGLWHGYTGVMEENLIGRLGLFWTQAFTLWALTLWGVPHPEDSGFSGFLVSQQHVRTFSNQCFIGIIAVGWNVHSLHQARFCQNPGQGAQGQVGVHSPARGKIEAIVRRRLCATRQQRYGAMRRSAPIPGAGSGL